VNNTEQFTDTSSATVNGVNYDITATFTGGDFPVWMTRATIASTGQNVEFGQLFSAFGQPADITTNDGETIVSRRELTGENIAGLIASAIAFINARSDYWNEYAVI
jgi:hypothetical protein